MSRWISGACLLCCAALAVAEDPVQFDVRGFGDGASHWRRIKDPNRFIQMEDGQGAYQPTEFRKIAANILLFQRANGGWPKDYDMLAVLTKTQRENVAATRAREDTSFDNHNIAPQVEYLARTYTETGEEIYREGAERGIDFILSAQYPNGGWPQWFPKHSGYHSHITFNDGAMMGCMRLLRDVAESKDHLKWVDETRRNRAKESVERGIECILKCQIRSQGLLTGWCQQHDRETFDAAPARTFELASNCPGETSEIVDFLMEIEIPDERVVEAVERGVNWLRSVELRGIAVKRVPTDVVEFEKHTADFDVIVVREQNTPPIWARHYEIDTDRPIFASRDGVKRYALSEISRERRTGTKWYGDWPTRIVYQKYPSWRARLHLF